VIFTSYSLILQNYYLYKGSCQGHLVQCRRNQDAEVEVVVAEAEAVLEEEEEIQTVLVAAGEDEEAVVVVLEAAAGAAEAVSTAIEIPVVVAAVLIEEEVDLGTVVVEAAVLKSGNCAKCVYGIKYIFTFVLSVMIELKMSINSYNI